MPDATLGEPRLVIIEIDQQAALTRVCDDRAFTARRVAESEYVIVAAHDTLEAARDVAARDGLLSVSFRYRVGAFAADIKFIAERRDPLTGRELAEFAAEGLNVPADLEIVESAGTLADARRKRDEVTCPACGAYNADPEGYGGYCGDCSQRLDAATGTASLGRRSEAPSASRSWRYGLGSPSARR